MMQSLKSQVQTRKGEADIIQERIKNGTEHTACIGTRVTKI